jgi:hypothetical protein
VRTFVDDILVYGRLDRLARYFDGERYIQHNPHIADNLSGLASIGTPSKPSPTDRPGRTTMASSGSEDDTQAEGIRRTASAKDDAALGDLALELS